MSIFQKNPYQYWYQYFKDVLIDIDIFKIAISIFSKMFLLIFSRLSLSILILIFFKSVDISTIKISYWYIELGYPCSRPDLNYDRHFSFSQTSNKTFVTEESSLVLETLEEGRHHHYLIPIQVTIGFGRTSSPKQCFMFNMCILYFTFHVSSPCIHTFVSPYSHIIIIILHILTFKCFIFLICAGGSSRPF